MMEVSFVIPCFNERPELLQETISKLKISLDQAPQLHYEVIVVDDGSTKYTYTDIARDQVILLSHPRNKGYGASLLTGISRARYPWIGITDADGTYPLDYFPALLAHLDNYDMVVGSRNWDSISALRRPAKRLLTRLASFIANYQIPDLNSGMRLFKKELVEKYLRIFPLGFSFTSTLTMICLTNIYDLKFVDIPYYKRLDPSHISPLKDTARFLSQILRLALYFRPMRFFMPLTGVIAACAVLRGIRDILVNDRFGGLTLVLFFMAFQVFFFGLIAEIINKK
ncbi:MAG: glycosyltransferase family 2 protein [Thermodesulfobacteriota bacterium]